MKKVKEFLLVLCALLTLSSMFGCSDDAPTEPQSGSSAGGNETPPTAETSGLYMGVIGFNESLKKSPIQLLTSYNYTYFTNYIRDLETAKATVLYYAVDEAINDLESASLPDDLISASIVTFTDGLDQGSTMLNPSYSSNGYYLHAISNRINTVKIKNQPITAYSIGLKGNDVTDTNQFMANLESLASSGNSYLANNMDEVNTTFEKIANQLITRNTSQTLSLKIPGLADRTKIRFTFDNVSSADNSTIYIEGTLFRTDNSLRNIKYEGVQSSSGTIVNGEQDGVYLTFTFKDFDKGNGTSIDKEQIKEWYCLSGSNQWQGNSEFSPENDIEVENIYKSAVIMLVLDCSSSLGSDFEELKGHAQNFIIKLLHAKETGSTDNSGDNGNEEGDAENEINGHEYVDLGLPSGLLWATCNVGATNPEDYGNYYAWGETTTKSTYTESNNTTYGVSMGDISGDSRYDAATANWGGTWRMPTDAEMGELIDNCTWAWTTQNEVNGYKVTGPNGNSIFLPASGYRSGSSLIIAGSNGDYWSSTPDGGTYDAYYLYFGSGYYGRINLNRYYGRGVRPVSREKQEEQTPPATDANGHEYVDLGLPSGLKWATCNVGATNPEDYGDYFAWGETATKSTYTESNSTTYGVSMSDISGNAEYDAATANWGGTWRMPTNAEFTELRTNCTWTWTTLNEVNGYKVTGPNGNSIFLPAAGWRDGSSLYGAGSFGGYWSSAPSSTTDSGAYRLLFYSSNYRRNEGYYRSYGHSVRPVTN